MKQNVKKENLEMHQYLFNVIIEEDEMEDGRAAFSARCPALPAVNTWGYTYEEALANARDAVRIYVESLLARGKDVPIDPDHGAVEVSQPAAFVSV
jgi:predicted RNase H-like HicB family nuclease